MPIHTRAGHEVELVNVLIVVPLLTPKVVEGGDLAGDVDKATGRKPVEHERTSHRVATKAFQKSAYEETLSREMPFSENGSSACACLNCTARSTISLP